MAIFYIFEENPIVTAKKNIGKKIVVNSDAYGRHERAARGSLSKVGINKAMRAHGRRLRKSNVPAKLIADALQPFRYNFKGGMFWQKLVKHFSAQAKNGAPYSVSGIGHWDLNERLLTSRLMTTQVRIDPDPFFSNLEVSVNYILSNRFMIRKKNITSFRISFIFLFPDFKNNEIKTIPVILPDKLLTDNSAYSFVVKIPRKANEYLVCFKCEACRNGEIYSEITHIDKAMCLIGSGHRKPA